MALTPGFGTAGDLLQKLHRDQSLLDSEVTADRFFNFVVTAYSLVDWVANDPHVPLPAKEALTAFRQAVELKICRDIANSMKHFQLNSQSRQKSITAGTGLDQGFGRGRWGHGGFGIGEPEITVELNDGSNFDALVFAASVLQLWRSFFSTHQIAPASTQV
ncbi:hypothetical protein [Burkholderia contaminans]|uniref:hypothetical protein n=1 Tax=Burkholderia contaminans TaxID=488447 RepID=UPI003D67DB0E